MTQHRFYQFFLQFDSLYSGCKFRVSMSIRLQNNYFKSLLNFHIIKQNALKHPKICNSSTAYALKVSSLIFPEDSVKLWFPIKTTAFSSFHNQIIQKNPINASTGNYFFTSFKSLASTMI
jgi:hypothetical protein